MILSVWHYNSLYCAEVPLRNCSLILTHRS